MPHADIDTMARAQRQNRSPGVVLHGKREIVVRIVGPVGEAVTLRSVSADLERNPCAEIVRLIVDCKMGGDVLAALEIRERLLADGRPIRAEVRTKAASAATLVMTAATNITAYRGCALLYHWPHALNAAGAAILTLARQTTLDVLLARARCSRNDLIALLDKDEWISPLYAARLGLVDEVMG
jgi:ATP-dependent protease ClpP protease subunit